MTAVTLRNMTVDDLPAVMAIEKVSFPQPWSETMFRLELHNPDSICVVAETNARVTGYFCAAIVLDEMDLRVIAVAPAARRMRIGEQLVSRMIDCAREKKVGRIHLEVRESNTGAQNLYRKFGFRQVGRRKRYYDLPVEDALLFTLKLL